MKAILLILSALVLAGAPACSDSGGAPSPFDHAASVNENLTLGSRGDAVREVTQSLTAYGYFPNPELAGTFPGWRPVVPVAPADVSIFDDRTAQAVLEFQGRNGLPATGIADQATRSLLQQPRCGVPDSARLDSADKFARLIDLPAGCNKWTTTNAYYKATTPLPPGTGITLTAFQNAAQAAVSAWQATGSILPISPAGSGSSNVTIQAGTFTGSAAKFIAGTTPKCDASGNLTSAVITLNNIYTFSTASPTPTGAFDLQTIVTHELGHVLGLQHSSDPSAAMYAFNSLGVQRRSTDEDDAWGISSLYERLSSSTTAPLVVDIGASGAGGLNHYPWAIDASGAIYQFNNTSWVKDTTGSNAYAISVSADTTPYIVSNDSGIYFKPSASATSGTPWIELAAGPTNGYTYDIGVGGSGSVWIIADPVTANGEDAAIWQWNSASATWIRDNAAGLDSGGGMRIAVTIATTGQPVPYIVNYAGEVWRKTSGLAQSGSWQPILTPDPVGAIDIGVSNSSGNGLDNYAWITGGDGNVYMFQQQDATDGGPPTPAFFKWVQVPISVPGGAASLAVQSTGNAWIVANSGKIYRAF